MKSLIIGAGKYGEVYLSYLIEEGIEVIGFLDDDNSKIGTKILGIPVLGPISSMTDHCAEAVYCPIGNNSLRVDVLNYAQNHGLKTPNFIHKDVKISPDVKISQNGVYILGNTLIMPHVKIGDYVMISVGSNIIHHTTLERGVFVSNGVNLGASINVKPLAYIGMGATIMTGVNIVGKDSLIGAGATVIKDVPDFAVMAGVPARIVKFKQHIDTQEDTG